MSVHLIYYKDGAKMMRPVLNREEYLALRNSEEQQRLVHRVRNGETKLKNKLLQMNYSCLPNADGSLRGSKQMSSTIGMDVDFKAPDNLSPEEQLQWLTQQLAGVPERVLAKKDELCLLMLERSATKGFHLVFRRRPELSQEENLKWASLLLGVEYDTGAKDITRVFFTTTARQEDLLYLDDAIFENTAAEVITNTNSTNSTNKEVITNTDGTDNTDNPLIGKDSCNSSDSCSKEKNPSDPNNPCSEIVTALPDGATSGARQSSSKLDSAIKKALPDGDLAVTALQCDSSKTTYANSAKAEYNGVAFKDIIRKYWELFNGGKEPVEGDRNALTFELAVTLRSICGFSLERLMQVVPNYWAKSGTAESVSPEDYAEWKKTLENALKEPHKGMPYRLKQVLQALKSQQGVKACGGTLTAPPPMPKKLPPLIRLLTKNVPWYYKPAVASAVFPALGVHLHGVKFRYWDNVEHEATFMNVLIGQQSIGKGSVKKPIEYIMEDIRQRDLPNRQREAEWKQKNPGAKQKKDPRPADICIQMLIDNLTDAVFNQRIVDANNNGERFIYTSVDEIEALKKVTSRGTADEVGLLIRKAFDNSLAGQERVGADSVSGIAPLRWNFNASTTPPNARRFFGKMVNDGTVSRLDVATIIRADDDEEDEAPVLGLYDEQFAQELKPYIERLEAASGLIECPQAKRLALDIRTENRDAARLYESEAYRVLSYRANVIAWLKGMLLYVAHDYHWSKEIADFVRWTEQYNLWCKMLYFGQQLEKELREEIEIQRQSGPQNLLDLLPDEFNKEQYRLMRQQQGKTGDGDATLRQWQTRGYIAYDEVSGRYCKIGLKRVGFERVKFKEYRVM